MKLIRDFVTARGGGFLLFALPCVWTAARADTVDSVSTFWFPSDVRITIQSPAPSTLDTAKRTILILYALPNGNSTEQTAGRRLREGDDWHVDIQHIAAQTRFLRRSLAEANLITVYLEAGGKSWPAWRRQHPGSAGQIVAIVDSLSERFRALHPKIALSGHSGGGSFIFGYIDGVKEIPPRVERIAWLDAVYGYEDSLHGDKLLRWLRSGERPSLAVFAYNDSVALLNGKPFVSATGGTWHRSRLMQERLAREFSFAHARRGPTRLLRALDGRIQFFLTENPERTILHTVIVERNGFIHAILAGTRKEELGYAYLGERAYSQWIDPEEIRATR